MTEEEIWETIEAYGAAARRAVEAGVDVLAVHGAHGYLIHSFASPAVSTLLSNFVSSPFYTTRGLSLQRLSCSRTKGPINGVAALRTALALASRSFVLSDETSQPRLH